MTSGDLEAVKHNLEDQPAQVLKWLHNVANMFVCDAAVADSLVVCIEDVPVHTVPATLGVGVSQQQGLKYLPQTFKTKHLILPAPEPISESLARIAVKVEALLETKIQVVFIDFKLFSGGAKGLTLLLSTILDNFKAVLKSEAVFMVFFT